MEVRETIHTRVEGTQVQSLNIGDKIQIIQLTRRFRNATPTTTSNTERYPEGFECQLPTSKLVGLSVSFVMSNAPDFNANFGRLDCRLD